MESLRSNLISDIGAYKLRTRRQVASEEIEAATPPKARTISAIEGDPLNSRGVTLLFRRERQYRKGEALFAQGDRADALYLVRAGCVKLTVTSSGKGAVLRLVGSGGVFGEECLNSEHPCNATAVAIEPSIVAQAPKARIVRTLRRHPTVTGELIRHLLLRVERVEEELVDLILNSSEKRLARILVTLAGSEKGSIGSKRLPAVNQKTLAEMVGTTRSRVSYFMNRFRRLGFIDYNGSLQIHPALMRFLDQK